MSRLSMRRGVTYALVALGALAAGAAGAQQTHFVPFFPAAPAPQVAGTEPLRQGFVRVINHSAAAGQVSITGFDDTGQRAGPVTLELAGSAVAHINSNDFQRGNPNKGIATGVGAPRGGDWWLSLASDLDIEVNAYIRAADGFLTSVHDLTPASGGSHQVAFFNPGSNTNQQSRLRVVNPGDAPVEVAIRGVDDAGRAAGPVRATAPARGARTFTAQDLESGMDGADGRLGDGAGKWQLTVAASGPVRVMSLLANPTGHIANLSTAPPAMDANSVPRQVPLFPAATQPNQGFLRVINRGGTVNLRIDAYDEDGTAHGPVTLSLGAGRTAHFNSTDLEGGNTAKGLSGGVGAGVGDWRLVVGAPAPTSDMLDVQVLGYIRSPEGFVTSMHEVVPSAGTTHRVATFNPGSNILRQSLLRVVNLGAAPATVLVAGASDDGAPSGEVVFVVPADGANTASAQQLEAGAESMVGALGTGSGKWRLAVTANQPILAMSLLRRPNGPLTNLSTTTRELSAAPGDGAPPRQTVSLLDAIPGPGVDVDPGTRHINMVHTANAHPAYFYSAPCHTGVAVRHALPGAADEPQREVVDHRMECGLTALANVTARADGRGTDKPVGSALSFTTGSATDGPALRVLHVRTVPRDTVNEMLDGYIENALIEDIESRTLQLLAAILIDQIAERTWAELRNPGARYDVVAQRVSYASRTPAGAPSSAVTGLVAIPEIGAVPDFSRKNRVVVLSHATGATPSDQDDGDAWYALANMFAGRGYLTIAPDNWGRGELATPGQPETYLMGNRSANNSVDLLKAVLASDDYQAFHDGAARRTDVSVVGYSQGAHTAVALWAALHTGEHGVAVRELFAGGGPHNLLATFRGALQRFAGECDGNEWCRRVDNDVVLPYVVGRILPALLAYTDIGFSTTDILEGRALRSGFVTGFLAGEAEYESLQAILALNSYTNLVAPGNAIRHGTQINLYHSIYDRLVPQANTRELAALLGEDFDVVHHEDECRNNVYESLFDLVDRVGVLHLICGMEVLDDVLKRFP